jgi:hypothetical protein
MTDLETTTIPASRLDPPPPLPPLFFMPRYMWMHSHPYTGRVPARPTYPTMNN